jgi:hypothetical protein
MIFYRVYIQDHFAKLHNHLNGSDKNEILLTEDFHSFSDAKKWAQSRSDDFSISLYERDKDTLCIEEVSPIMSRSTLFNNALKVYGEAACD